MHITRISQLYNRSRRRILSKVWFARLLAGVTIVVLVVIGWIVLKHPAGRVFSGLELITGKALPQSDGRMNLVLLGTGGEGHEGPDLTDTIIFTSIKLDTGETTLISIPRDLWIPSLQVKINEAYHYGMIKESTPGALSQSRSIVHEMVNQPVHFAVKVDFSTFEKAIDILGGVDIVVDRTFDDYEYPIPGLENDLCNGDPETRCRYEHLHFDAGEQHLEGKTALKFVRSRHSTDPLEGSDFARSKRQEKILSAVKAKLTSIDNLKNSDVYKQLYDLAVNSVDTDITPEYYSSFFQLGLKIRKHAFKIYSIEDYLENPPISPQYLNKWVLIPKGSNSKALYEYVGSLLAPPSSDSSD